MSFSRSIAFIARAADTEKLYSSSRSYCFIGSPYCVDFDTVNFYGFIISLLNEFVKYLEETCR